MKSVGRYHDDQRNQCVWDGRIASDGSARTRGWEWGNRVGDGWDGGGAKGPTHTRKRMRMSGLGEDEWGGWQPKRMREGFMEDNGKEGVPWRGKRGSTSRMKSMIQENCREMEGVSG